MSSNGWQGKGDVMEDSIERWLLANSIRYRRADDMKTHLDFFLPDFNVYIEVKRYHTPRIADQLQRAPDIIIIQGGASMRFLESLIARSPALESQQIDDRVRCDSHEGALVNQI